MLEGILQDDSWFAFIAAADENDDWTDPAVWRKANPNFGLSVKEDDLARKAEKAIALPGAQNAFRRMHLNEWTEQAERWIDMAAWDACDAPVDLELLRGRPCFGGLDLSTTTDVTALAWVFPPDHDDDLWRVLSRYFVPAENLRKRAERDRVPYDLWAAQGFIEATPGNVVDYGAIEQRIRADAALFQVREIAYDPWNATHIALRLQDEGAAMVEFRQGFRSMAAPTRELEKLIVSRKLAHGGNPVTRWMAANVAVAQDPAGNLKPAKDKIDRAHRRHRRADHGDRPRHGRPGGAAALVPDVHHRRQQGALVLAAATRLPTSSRPPTPSDCRAMGRKHAPRRSSRGAGAARSRPARVDGRCAAGVSGSALRWASFAPPEQTRRWLPRRRSRRESSTAPREPRLTERRPPALERQQ